MKYLYAAMAFVAIFSQEIFADSWDVDNFQVITDVTWNVPGHQLELICKKSSSGSIYNFKCDWNAPGNSIENAKVLLSILLTAKSTGTAFNIYGDHNGAAPTWNNFTAVSIREP